MRGGDFQSQIPSELAQAVAPIHRSQSDAELICAMRAQATYLIHRYGRVPQAESLQMGMRARLRSLEKFASLESRVAIEEAEVEAEQAALLDALDAVDDDERRKTLRALLVRHARRLGELRAERSRIDARMLVEARAFNNTLKLFNIRFRSGYRI